MPLYYSLSAVLFFIGIANPLHIPPWNSFHSEFFCYAATAIIFSFKYINGEISLKKENYLFLIIFIFFLLYISINNTFDASINLIIYLSIYIASFISGINSKSLKDKHIFIFLIIIGVFLSFSLIVQSLDLENNFLIIPNTEATRRPGSSLLQANHAATFICMALICCLHEKSISSQLKLILFLILSFALAITESRTGILSFSIFSIYATLNREFRKISNLLYLAIAITIFTATPIIYDIYYLNDILSLPRTHLHGGRLTTWPILIDAISANPWTGYGFNNVFYALDAQIRITPSISSEPYHYAHNILIDLAIWFGLPLSLLISLYGLKKIYCIFYKKKGPLKLTLIPIITHCFFEYPHAYIYFGSIAAFVIGKIYAKEIPPTPIKSHTRYILPFFIFLFTIFYASLYINSEELIRAMRFASLGIKNSNKNLENLYILPSFNLEKESFKIKPSNTMTDEDLRKIKFLAQHRPSKTNQTKYAASLFKLNKCNEFESQINSIRSYYGKNYLDLFMKDIKSSFTRENYCLHKLNLTSPQTSAAP